MTDETISTDTSEIESTPVAEGDSTAQVEGSEVQPTEAESQNEQSHEDSFFDPNKVPEELKGAYKQMQADYTRKTQAIAEERKQAAEWKSKADLYSKHENLLPIVEEMLSGSQNQQVSDPEMAALTQELKNQGYSEEAIQMMTMGAKFILNQVNQKETLKSEQQKQEQFQKQLESQIDEAQKVDARLTDESLVYDIDGEQVKFGDIVGQMVISDPNWRQNPVAATQKALKKVDALIGKAKVEGKEELSNLAKGKSQKYPQINSSPQSATRTSNPKSITEAFEEAKKELGI